MKTKWKFLDNFCGSFSRRGLSARPLITEHKLESHELMGLTLHYKLHTAYLHNTLLFKTDTIHYRLQLIYTTHYCLKQLLSTTNYSLFTLHTSVTSTLQHTNTYSALHTQSTLRYKLYTKTFLHYIYSHTTSYNTTK